MYMPEKNNNINIVAPITLVVVLLIWQIGDNMTAGYIYDEYRKDYTKLLISGVIIKTAIISISSLVAYFILRYILVNSPVGKRNENMILLNRFVLIGCGCILMFGLFKGYTCIPAVHNYAVLNNLGEEKSTVLKIIKEYKKIHILSTCIYTTVSTLILYFVGMLMSKIMKTE